MKRSWILFILAIVVTATAAPFLMSDGDSGDDSASRDRDRPVRAYDPDVHDPSKSRRSVFRRDNGGRPAGTGPVRDRTDQQYAAPPPKLAPEDPSNSATPRARGVRNPSNGAMPSEDEIERRREEQEAKREQMEIRRRELEQRRQAIQDQRNSRAQSNTRNDAARQSEAIERRREELRRQAELARQAGQQVARPTYTTNNMPATVTAGEAPRSFEQPSNGRNADSGETAASENGESSDSNSRSDSSDGDSLFDGSGAPQDVLDYVNDFFRNRGGTSGSSDEPVVTVGGGGNVVTNPSTGATNVTARWLPVDNRSCAEVSGLLTNDLYLRLDTDARVVSIEIGGARSEGLVITGGEFYQHPLGGNARPSQSVVRGAPCAAFDSYLALGTASIGFVPTPPEPDAEAWGSLLEAGYFSVENVTGRQSTGLFGDNGYYVQIARLTAPAPLDDLSGEIRVTIQSGTTQESVLVEIPHCTECWSTDSAFYDDSGAPDDGDGEGDDGGSDDGGDVDGGDGGGDDVGGEDPDGGDPGDDVGGSDPDSPDGGDGSGEPDDGSGDGDGDPDDGGSGDDPDDEELPRVAAAWYVVNNDCDDDGDGESDLEGFMTADLYLSMDGPHRVLSVLSGPSLGNNAGVTILGGNFYQNPFGSNVMATPAQIGIVPCLAFDSYLTLGDVAPGFLFEPDSSNWGQTLMTGWFVTGVQVRGVQNAPIADGRYYVRLGRFTVPTDAASVAGEIEVGVSYAGEGSTQTIKVTLPELMLLAPTEG